MKDKQMYIIQVYYIEPERFSWTVWRGFQTWEFSFSLGSEWLFVWTIIPFCLRMKSIFASNATKFKMRCVTFHFMVLCIIKNSFRITVFLYFAHQPGFWILESTMFQKQIQSWILDDSWFLMMDTEQGIHILLYINYSIIYCCKAAVNVYTFKMCTLIRGACCFPMVLVGRTTVCHTNTNFFVPSSFLL
jgi:hypothetical protein